MNGLRPNSGQRSKLNCPKSFGHDKILFVAPRHNFSKLIYQSLHLETEGWMAALAAGSTAPDFELPAVTGKQRHKFRLSDLRDKQNAILAFYPLDWSPT
jgi:hypothetical protein